MSKNRGTWVDNLTIPGVFLLAAIGMSVASLVSGQLRLSSADMPLLSLCSGVSVGLVLAANLRSTQCAAVFGGASALALPAILSSASIGSVALILSSYFIEVGTALAGLSLVVAWVTPSRETLSSFIAQPVCLLAALLGAIPQLFLSLSDLQGVIDYTLSHGIGLAAVASTLLVGRYKWISTRNPRRHIPILLFVIASSQALLVVATRAEPSILFVSLILIAVISSAFGNRVGAPLALLSAVVLSIAVVTDPRSALTSSVYTIYGFTGAAVSLAHMLGRIASASDTQMVREIDSVKRVRKLAATGFDGYVDIDKDLIVVDMSDSIQESLTAEAGEIRGKPLHNLFTSEDARRLARTFERLRSGATVRADRGFKMATGETRWALIIATPRYDRLGNFDGATVYTLDTTMAHEVNSKRLASEKAVVDAQENERVRVAQLVHDGALQDFAAASLLIDAIKMNEDWTAQIESLQVIENGLTAKDYIDRIDILIKAGMKRLRLDAIGPKVVDLRDVDVREHLEATIAKFAPTTTATVDLQTHKFAGASPEQSRIILQIAREALVNAIVHSTNASVIEVDVRSTRDGYCVSVLDDGIGFDPTRLQEVGHLGLENMTAFALQAGGWCSLWTRPGRGTTVEAWIPHSETNAEAVAVRLSDSLLAISPRALQ